MSVKLDIQKYSPDQPRDDRGRWGEGGGGSAPSGSSSASAAEQSIRQLLGHSTPVWVAGNNAHALQAAKATYGVLHDMKLGGYKMPDAVVIAVTSKTVLGGETTVTAPSSGPLSTLNILIPDTLPPDVALDAIVDLVFQADPNKFAVGSMSDIVIHEMAHVQAGLLTIEGDLGGFDSAADRETASTVSSYAATDANEFVAESFLRLYRGETLSAAAQTLYERFGGPGVLHKHALLRVEKYSPDEPRDEHGRWTSGGGSADKKPAGSAAPNADAAETHRVAIEHDIEYLLPADSIVSVGRNQHVLEAANAAYEVLSEMKDRGYKMPESVIVSAVIQEGPSGSTNWPQGRAHLSIDVPHNIPPEVSLDTVVKNVFQDHGPEGFAVANTRDIVVHEMGHVLAGNRNELDGASGFGSESNRKIANTVSHYASKSVNEFIAESFTRLYRGETLKPKAQALYDKVNGPKVRT